MAMPEVLTGSSKLALGRKHTVNTLRCPRRPLAGEFDLSCLSSLHSCRSIALSLKGEIVGGEADLSQMCVRVSRRQGILTCLQGIKPVRLGKAGSKSAHKLCRSL